MQGPTCLLSCQGDALLAWQRLAVLLVHPDRQYGTPCGPSALANVDEDVLVVLAHGDATQAALADLDVGVALVVLLQAAARGARLGRPGLGLLLLGSEQPGILLRIFVFLATGAVTASSD